MVEALIEKHQKNLNNAKDWDEHNVEKGKLEGTRQILTWVKTLYQEQKGGSK